MAGTTGIEIVEEGAPAFDSVAFRHCVGEFVTGVTVVTAEVAGQRVGVTANSFSSLSLDPPLVLWAIGHSSRSHASFRNATHFAINILGVEQVKVSQIFSSKVADKFAAVQWSPGLGGSPLIEGALAVLECEKEAAYDIGDHLLLIGRVRRFGRREGKGLLFAQGRYGMPAEHPDIQESNVSVPARTAVKGWDLPFATLIARTYHEFQRQFERHRQAEGVTLNENKVLIGLFDQPPMPLDTLAKRTYFGQRELEDAVRELERRGFIQNDNGMLSLTAAGQQKRIKIMERVRMVDTDRLSGLTNEELETTEKVLRKLYIFSKDH